MLVRVVLRIVVQKQDDEEPKGGLGANSGILPRLDRGASRRRLLDRGPDGQLRVYSPLRDLGDITVITDPGSRGRICCGPVSSNSSGGRGGARSHVIVWRLDRLSRNLGDLMALADLFGERGVVCTPCRRTSISHRRRVGGSSRCSVHAQYFREELSENVKMGIERAVKEGRWINRPKTGYDLAEGLLVPNDDAPRVQEIFRLRGKTPDYRAIEEQTGIKYSTVSRIWIRASIAARSPPQGQMVRRQA